MKLRKFIAFVTLIVYVVASFNMLTYAHDAILNVNYDTCVPEVIRDGEDETWYVLSGLFYKAQNENESDIYAEYHLSDEITTIKYYFSPNAENDDTYTWITDIYQEYKKTMSEEEALVEAEIMAEEIKEAYADSMKKWNDVYYYSYDENGYRHAHQIINVVEGTYNDHNLTIYPIAHHVINNDGGDGIKAATLLDSDAVELETTYSGVKHLHYSAWKMNVNVNYFFQHAELYIDTPEKKLDGLTWSDAYYYRDFVGQHELGHVLGLGDVDSLCTENTQNKHHSEILMGYVNGLEYATYKDIAGVSITRGFHTDSDHIWMLRRNTDGTNDVICSLCNGVRYNVSLSADGTYENQVLNMYRSCTHHNGTNHDMLLVATDGTRDFYKCQYCRYIFELKIDSEETVSMSSGGNSGGELEYGTQKMYKLNVLHEEMYDITVSSTKKFTFELYDADLKLIYSLSEGTYNNFDIDLTEGTYYIRVYNSNFQTVNFNLSIQPPPHTHEYTEWVYHSPTQHIACCECGALGTQTNNHVVKVGTAINNRGICMFCGAVILLGEEFVPALPFAAVQVTLNGSYILPNGIIVLVDEDVEAYLNGTLVFYNKDDLPVTQ